MGSNRVRSGCVWQVDFRPRACGSNKLTGFVSQFYPSRRGGELPTNGHFAAIEKGSRVLGCGGVECEARDEVVHHAGVVYNAGLGVVRVSGLF